MAEILSTVSAIVTAGFTWAGQAVTFITSNPLVLLFVALPLVGLGIGFLTRLIRG